MAYFKKIEFNKLLIISFIFENIMKKYLKLKKNLFKKKKKNSFSTDNWQKLEQYFQQWFKPTTNQYV